MLAIAAHLDTVFPAGTNLKVRKEGHLYYGPGIGDNASGLRSMLQVLRALEKAGIETDGDILFVGTVGEEGNGDIRGAKALFDGSRKIDGFMALDMADVFTVQNGATALIAGVLPSRAKAATPTSTTATCPPPSTRCAAPAR